METPTLVHLKDGRKIEVRTAGRETNCITASAAARSQSVVAATVKCLASIAVEAFFGGSISPKCGSEAQR